MEITNMLMERGLITDRERATGYVTARLETGTGMVDDLSTRVHDAARERGFGSASNAVDTLVEKAISELIDDPNGVVEGAIGEHDPAYSTDDLSERALETFLRRYDLDRARLNERTLETIRDELAAELNADPSHVRERLAAEWSSRIEAKPELESDTGPSFGRVLTEVQSQLRAELDIGGDQPFHRALDDVLQQDAIDVAHGVERALAEGLPRSVETEPIKTTETVEPVRSIAVSAIAAMILMADDGSRTRSLAHVLSELVSGRMGMDADSADDRDPPAGRILFELVSTLIRETDEDGLDLDFALASLRSGLNSERTGSRALVALFVANFVAMALGAWVSRERAPPIPDEIQGPEGQTVVTDEQVRAGKKAFQANGLMNHGSILGNGSYFGVDLTADALRLKAEFMREYYARQRGTESFGALTDDGQAAIEEQVERELDTDAPVGSVAQYSAAGAYAHRRVRDRYVDRYYGGAPERGVPSGFVESPRQAERIADFALWTAWMTHTDRPGSDHSYTNDWPYVPGTGNRPTGQVLVWSTISLVLLVAGGGIGVWAYHAFNFAEPTTETVDVPSPDEVSITPTQYAAAWYIPVAGVLFLTQVLVGALLAHYYVERTGFFGIDDALGVDIVSLVPFSVGRTWHINLAVLWITTLWLAGGLFLPGLFTDRDPRWQAAGTTALLGLLVSATVGAFAGVWLGSRGAFGSPEEGELWWWLGSEGLEYLEVGRFWKLLLLGGFVVWTGLVLRSVRRLDEPPTGLGHFMTYAGGSIALMFAASMLYTPETNIAVTEFWRWWVVHMWVEGVFEFFVTAVISVALVSMNLVERSEAERAILFEVFAIMGAGIVGVSHHYWWVGLPDLWVPIGTTFSTLEFVPLMFILYRSLGEYRSLKAQSEEFPYTLPLLFIIGSSLWNFVGGGVLGFFINLPVINYYEHGTYLTVAHGHAATFGAFGLLALGLGTYVLRVVTPEAAWDPTWFRGAFWLTNVGLTIMVVASLLPVGFLQLQTAYSNGYAAARSLEFYEQSQIQTLLWTRTLGDTPMILGALAFTVAAIRHLYAARRSITAG